MWKNRVLHCKQLLQKGRIMNEMWVLRISSSEFSTKYTCSTKEDCVLLAKELKADNYDIYPYDKRATLGSDPSNGGSLANLESGGALSSPETLNLLEPTISASI